MSARERGIRSVMATASLSSDWHIEEPSGKDGTIRARRHPRIPPLGGVCDCEELRTPSERDPVPRRTSVSWGRGPDLCDLGFPICEVEVVSRMGKSGLSTGPGHGMCSGNGGALIIIVAVITVALQLGPTSAGCGVSGLSDVGPVMVCQAS